MKKPLLNHLKAVFFFAKAFAIYSQFAMDYRSLHLDETPHDYIRSLTTPQILRTLFLPSAENLKIRTYNGKNYNHRIQIHSHI